MDIKTNREIREENIATIQDSLREIYDSDTIESLADFDQTLKANLESLDTPELDEVDKLAVTKLNSDDIEQNILGEYTMTDDFRTMINAELKEEGVTSLSYVDILKLLKLESNTIKTIHDVWSSKIDELGERYVGDEYLRQAEKIDASCRQLLDEEVDKINVVFGNFKLQKQNALDTIYLGNVDANLAGELDNISKSDLTEREMKGYLNKFKNNQPALRRFNSILKNQGYKIVGSTYDSETQFFDYFVKQVNEVSSFFYKQNGNIGLDIAVRLLVGKTKDYLIYSYAPHMIAKAN